MDSTIDRQTIIRLLALGALMLLLGGLQLALPVRADAAVVHGRGYQATVLGWTSWYGSYEIDGVGTAWCIDHGLQAPDVAFGYQPTSVSDRPASARAAMAWVVSSHASSDPLTHAAVMLVLHDLGGAVYPYGRLDVNRLLPSQLAGFGGREGELLALARELKADATAHSGLRAPFHLALVLRRAEGEQIRAEATLTDAAGTPLAGVPVSIDIDGGTRLLITDSHGSATVKSDSVRGDHEASASASLPDPTLHALAPAQVAAQRVAVPTMLELRAVARYKPPATTPSTTTIPPTTTTTTPPSTTTIPPATTTTTPPSTTTIPPATTTTTPPSTTTIPPTTTTIPPTTTMPPLVPPGSPPALVQTGSRARALALMAAGLLLIGMALREATNPAQRATR